MSLRAKVTTLAELVPAFTILGEMLPALLGPPPALRSYCGTLPGLAGSVYQTSLVIAEHQVTLQKLYGPLSPQKIFEF